MWVSKRFIWSIQLKKDINGQFPKLNGHYYLTSSLMERYCQRIPNNILWGHLVGQYLPLWMRWSPLEKIKSLPKRRPNIKIVEVEIMTIRNLRRTKKKIRKPAEEALHILGEVFRLTSTQWNKRGCVNACYDTTMVR